MPQGEKHDIRDGGDIRLLVNAFYDKARKDSLLGPVFDTIDASHWPAHVDRICAFWSGVLLHEGNYSGSPFMKHYPLNLNEAHYRRWLELWTSTLDELFEGGRKTDAATRAQVMAVMFQSKAGHLKSRGETPLL